MSALEQVLMYDSETAEAYAAEYRRLRRELRAIADRVERLESELRQLLGDLVRQRYEGYR
jgi:uncharacterized protein (UPF0335 family)